MSTSQQKSIREHLCRLKARADDIRRRLVALVTSKEPGLKDLLAAAPLAGICITRSRDRGRTVDL
ncbi:MAG: hypothetical protein ACE5KS_07665 [Woeseiaceae bacterium]